MRGSTGQAELDVDTHIGRRIRHRRRLLGYTQRDLGLACGVRFQQIQKYEWGMTKISAARLWALAQYLQAPMTYFFDGLAIDSRAPITELRPRNAA
jgi:transcriptional regulator with XRE-family HTH domain